MALYGSGRVGSRNRQGAWPQISLLAGAGLWGLIWYPMRGLEHEGIAPLWLSFLLYASALAASLPWVWRRLGTAGRVYPLLLLGLFAGWTNIAFVLAILAGNVVRVMLLFYLSPVWTVLLARLFLKERITRASIPMLLAATFGVVLLLGKRGTTASALSAADWLALSAGLAFSLSNIVTRALTGVSVATKSITVWAGVTVLAAVGLLTMSVPWGSPPVAAVLGAAGLGVGAILGMTLLIQYGVSHLPAQRSAVLMLFELIVGAASQHLLSNETLNPLAWAGAVLIAGAAWHAARTGR